MNWREAVATSERRQAVRHDATTDRYYYRNGDGSAFAVHKGRFEFNVRADKLEGFTDWEPVQ